MVNGADSIYLFNPKGSGFYFSDKVEEKVKLIDLNLNVTRGRLPILVGTFGHNRENIIEQLEIIGKKYNNISFIVSLPYTEKFSDIYTYFDSILSAVNINNDILLYNNPDLYGVEIDPLIVEELSNKYNIVGLVDSYDNINYCKSFIKLINADFSFFCENEPNFQKFFQIVPTELKQYVGIVSSVGNLVNLCSKLLYCAIEDKILELHQIQEQITDLGGKLYDIKVQSDRARRGLKYAFLFLYRNYFSRPIENYIYLYPDMPVDIDEITKKRIEAIVHYLLNQKQIYQLYPLGQDEFYQLDEIIKRFSKVEYLLNQGKINRIIGPLNAKTNTIYKVNFEKSQLIFRFRTSKSFKYENIVKEKLIYPLVDKTLDPSIDGREKFRDIITNQKGSYIFESNNPPIIPVGNLYYYDETKEIVPYIFSVQQHLEGLSLLDLFNQYNTASFNFSKSKFVNLFNEIGKILGRLHQISFNSFYNNVLDIGKKGIDWSTIFNSNLTLEIQKFKKIYPDLEQPILKYFKDNQDLIEQEKEPVLLHNDFQGSNVIVEDSKDEIMIKGIIDFDNWGIGVRSKDIAKMEMLTLDKINIKEISTSFYNGYKSYFDIKEDFQDKIDLYKLFWIIEKIDYLTLPHDIYLNEIARIINK